MASDCNQVDAANDGSNNNSQIQECPSTPLLAGKQPVTKADS